MTRACPSRPATSSTRPPRREGRSSSSSISLAEIVYLIEKNPLPANAYADLKAAIADPDHVFKEAPFTLEIVDAMREVPRADVPDMPDRIVAATSVYFGRRSSAATPHSSIQPENSLVSLAPGSGVDSDAVPRR